MPRNIEWNPGQIITLSFGDEVITFTNLGKMVAIEAPWRFEIDDGTEQSLHRRHYKKRNKRGEEDK